MKKRGEGRKRRWGREEQRKKGGKRERWRIIVRMNKNIGDVKDSKERQKREQKNRRKRRRNDERNLCAEERRRRKIEQKQESKRRSKA